jgi:hypothetical protein
VSSGLKANKQSAAKQEGASGDEKSVQKEEAVEPGAAPPQRDDAAMKDAQ